MVVNRQVTKQALLLGGMVLRKGDRAFTVTGETYEFHVRARAVIPQLVVERPVPFVRGEVLPLPFRRAEGEHADKRRNSRKY
jgi:hypothetical protein